MSDTDRPSDSFSIDKFKHIYRISDRRNDNVANVYILPAPCKNSCNGTIFFFHGYAGSPWETCMKIPMDLVYRHGTFNIVVIEGSDLSITSGTQKKLRTMTLPRQKRAILSAMELCRDLPILDPGRHIAWSHSMSARALVDLIIYSPFMREYFDEYVMANPYFMPPRRVFDLRAKILSRDPSGHLWNAFLQKSTTMTRTIENVRYEYPANLYNLWASFTKTWNSTSCDIAGQLNQYITGKYVSFLLGRQDNMAEYEMNTQYYDALPIPDKELIVSDTANHSFENAVDDLTEKSSYIIQNISRRCAHHNR